MKNLYKRIRKDGFLVFNTTFNNISAISWRSVLLAQETGDPRENHRPAACHCQTLSHNVVHLALSGIRTHSIRKDQYYYNECCLLSYRKIVLIVFNVAYA